MACRRGAAPRPVGFGVRPAQAGARHIKKEMRSPGIAPGSSDWQSESLLITYDRKSQKEQTPTERKHSVPQVIFHWRYFKRFRRLALP
jgi:hypothetical protein